MRKNFKIGESLSDEQAKKTKGGDKLEYWTVDGCSHNDKTPTNEYREQPYFIFWSRRQRKYICNICKNEVWINVD